MKKSNSISSHSSTSNLILIGSFIGLVSGLLAVAYRYAISQIELIRLDLYLKKDPWTILIYILSIGLITYILKKLLTWAPFSNGSGIPQIKAEVMNQLDDQPLPTIISKFFGGGLTALIGYSLGREGPSIQMGGMAGKWIAQKFKLPTIDQKYLMTAGASAGLSAAFNAPLAGILFAIEEIYGDISNSVIISSFSASIVANFVSYTLMGYETSFNFANYNHIPVEKFYILIILGLLCGIIAVFFNRALIVFGSLIQRIKVPFSIKIFVISCLVLITGYALPQVLGGGHQLIEDLAHNPLPLSSIFILLFVKICLTSVSYNAGVQGGIFLPVLVVGACSGAVVNGLLQSFLGLDSYLINCIILGMAGVLSGVVRAPLMSIILITEMTGSVSHFINLSLVAFIAMMTADLLKNPPVYHSLYDNLLLKIKKLSPIKRGQQEPLT